MENKFDYRTFRLRAQMEASKKNIHFVELMNEVAPDGEWSNWLKGTKEPSEEAIKKICEKLDCRPETLFVPITNDSSPEIVASLERVQSLKSKPKGRPPKEKLLKSNNTDGVTASINAAFEDSDEKQDENNNKYVTEDTTTAPSETLSLDTKPKRHRRTKAEMQAAREQEVKERESAMLKTSIPEDNNNTDTFTVNEESNHLSDPVKVDEDVSDKTETLSTTKTDNTINEDKDTNTNDNQSAFNATDSKTPEDIVFARTNVGMSYLMKADVVKPKRHRRTKAEMAALRAEAERIKQEYQKSKTQPENNNAYIQTSDDKNEGGLTSASSFEENLAPNVSIQKENEEKTIPEPEKEIEIDPFGVDDVFSDPSCNIRKHNEKFSDIEQMLTEVMELKSQYETKKTQIENMMNAVRDVADRYDKLIESTKTSENRKLFSAIVALDEESKKIVFDLVRKLKK